MAINSIDGPCDKSSSKSQGSSNRFKHGNLPARLVKIDFATEGSICSSNFKHGKLRKRPDYKSPYLSGDNVPLLSRVTGKRFVHKKGANIVSSFPLAANIYKANSDEFKASKNNKKVQKSVLTLPNEPAPAPQMCTVSDMNDSEYYNRADNNRTKTKKRIPAAHTRKCRSRGKNIEFYDRDAKYCSQMDIYLDSSSTDEIKNYNGDGKRTSKSIARSKIKEQKVNPHDVWAVLRNINRFQFRPSPPVSDDSYIPPKNIQGPRRRNNRKDMRFFETCCTEEFAYISSFEVDKNTGFSHSSSFDKVTVIDKQDVYNNKQCKGYMERKTKKKKAKLSGPRAYNKNAVKNKTVLPATANNFKAITYVNQKNRHDSLSEDSTFTICPNYRELKELLAKNMTVNETYENKVLTENNEDLYIDTSESPPISQCSELIYSGNSGSSKAALHKEITNKNNKDVYKSAQNNFEESNHQINGITKVVLSKGPNVEQHNNAELPKINPQPTITPSNPVTIPKLTKIEIKRQLYKQRFPMVILGKDQLSSTIEVINQEPPQFNGLDEQIWPFMLSWHGTEHSRNASKAQAKLIDSKVLKKKGKELEKHVLAKNNNVPKHSKLKDKNELKYKKIKIDYTRIPMPIPEIINESQEQIKPKPIQQFRDRMLKLLYKNSSILSVIDGSHSSDTTKNENNNKTMKINHGADIIKSENNNNSIKVNICTDTKVNLNARRTFDNPKLKTSSPVEKRPWAKAKWASDFIDNVIRKIKTGAYYTHDNKALTRKCAKDSKEVEIQTVSTHNTYADESRLSIAIPGFDEPLPAVEITTMNMNEISVKHCVTNVMVHFDVTVPMKPIVSVEDSSSLIPIDVTKSHTKIFKSQTSILNAMLPAELCSILPKMLRNIVHSGDLFTLLPIQIDKTSSQLSTISEVTHCNSPMDILDSISHSILPRMGMSQKICRLLNGRYHLNINNDKIFLKPHILEKKSSLVKYERGLVEELKPHLSRVYLFNCEVDAMMPIIIIKLQESMVVPSITSEKQIMPCTALQPYQVSDHRLDPSFKPFDLTSLFKRIESYANNNRALYAKMNSICKKVITLNMSMTHSFNSVQNTVTLSIGNFKMDPLNCCSKNSTSIREISLFTNTTEKIQKDVPICIENLETHSPDSSSNNVLVQKCVSVNNKKIRRKGFVKLYKKCKSTSNISGEKATPLTKITNLDDFFQALGSSKLLSYVFDSQYNGHKIMSAIEEMKNWTTEINPRQALLVLLLTNKTDTTNLSRYKPMLLQGIAVNRITKSHELDMEIEVIERENLNGLSRYEGISYLPASIENQDNLFEELCWIAKTTASDYQKPFDESSEKLIKSLLQKRKRLNPSYLRVMARYVGLGLLKSAGKK